MPLALFGGAPVIANPSATHRVYPAVTTHEEQLVLEALRSGELWGPCAPMTRQLENRWAAYIGTRFCVAMNSGTAALHSALSACGIGLGDEVIVPAFSFIASASCVLMCNAVPIFCDIDPRTLTLTVEHIKKCLTPRTRAVIAVHLHGQPADMPTIMDFARTYGLVVIEDACQAHGAEVAGRRVGSFGAAAAFSLNASKTLAGPEGGLLTTSEPRILNRSARLRVFGTEWRDDGYRERDADCIGYNYRTNELCAAFALARLDAFESETEARIENARALIAGLSPIEGLVLPPTGPGLSHIYQMLRVGLPLPNELANNPHLMATYRDLFGEALRAEGCRWSVWERKTLPEYEVFQTKNRDFRNTPWCFTQAGRDISYDPALTFHAIQAARSGISTTAHYPPNGTRLMAQYIDAFHKVWAQRLRLVDELYRVV